MGGGDQFSGGHSSEGTVGGCTGGGTGRAGEVVALSSWLRCPGLAVALCITHVAQKNSGMGVRADPNRGPAESPGGRCGNSGSALHLLQAGWSMCKESSLQRESSWDFGVDTACGPQDHSESGWDERNPAVPVWGALWTRWTLAVIFWALTLYPCWLLTTQLSANSDFAK